MKFTILRECVRIATERNSFTLHPSYSQYPHMSFIIQDNKIIEFGYNRCGKPPHGFGYADFHKIHSETDAYRKAKGVLDKFKYFEMINIRIGKNNDLKISKPCKCCMNFLKTIKCSKVYFSTDKGFFKLKIN